MKDHYRLVLTLDSHALYNYKRCPKLYEYTNIQNIEPRTIRPAFERGSVIAEMLAAYYENKKNNNLTPAIILEIIEQKLNPSELDDEKKELISTRFMQYYKMYKHETWIPLAIEQGFSKILYEDENVIFIYEGRPDLIARISSSESTILVVDHKHQTRRNEIYQFNDQVLGYLWGTEARFFIYNYFGLQETGKPVDWFRRSTFSFTPQQIEMWKAETINWYWQIADLLSTRPDDIPYFKKSWLCEGKYGTCEYHSLCEQTLPQIITKKIELEFKPREFKVW